MCKNEVSNSAQHELEIRNQVKIGISVPLQSCIAQPFTFSLLRRWSQNSNIILDKLGAGGNETKQETTMIVKGEGKSEMSKSKAFLMGPIENLILKEQDKRYS